jgi:hypothetical protein
MASGGAASHDTAHLQLVVGVVKADKSGYEQPPTVFAGTDFTGSAGAPKKAYLAKVIGADWVATKSTIQTEGATPTTGQLGTDIATNGFSQQKDMDKGVTFFFSGALTDATDTAITKITGQNESGNYTETLTFTLLAGF